MKSIRVGLVGCGLNSDNHLRVYSENRGTQLVAVCDRTLSKARAKAQEYRAHRALSDYESLLGLDLDLIDIVTPTPSHAKLSCMALETGHNVLVEKPMALTSGECQAMMQAARKSGRTLCVGHNKLFFNAVIQARTAVNNGALNPSRMRITHHFAYSKFVSSWRLSDDLGGLLWDCVVHPVYLVDHLLGPITSTYAAVRSVEEPVPDSFTVVLQNEKVGLAEFIWSAKQPFFELQLIGEDGQCFHADLVHDCVLNWSRDPMNRQKYVLGLIADDFRMPLSRWSRYLQNLLEIHSYPGALPFQRTFFVLIRQLASFLMGDQENPPVSPEEGVRAVRVLEAVRSSISTGEPQVVQT
jgi:predicted dehydrogenase